MITKLPLINAMFNSISTILILSGFIFIKSGNKKMHKIAMMGALTTSALFLISYTYYHFNKTFITTYQGEGLGRTIYLLILGSHSILAIVVLPLIFMAVRYALQGNHEKHKNIVKYTFPVWLYVSFTGVIIYLVLYVF